MISQTEENYLKAIFKISEQDDKPANTNAIAGQINTSAASVTDMIKRLSKKGLIHYKKHKGVTLTEEGNEVAMALIRKHRLWEVFLVEKLDFTWAEVHEIAEQLEHIKSQKLISRLDRFLGHPKFDPHGDPIPDENGKFTFRKQVALSELLIGDRGIIVGVQDHSSAFLEYLDQLHLHLGVEIEVLEKFAYDESQKIRLKNKEEQILTHKVCQNLFIQKI